MLFPNWHCNWIFSSLSNQLCCFWGMSYLERPVNCGHELIDTLLWLRNEFLDQSQYYVDQPEVHRWSLYLSCCITDCFKTYLLKTTNIYYFSFCWSGIQDQLSWLVLAYGILWGCNQAKKLDGASHFKTWMGLKDPVSISLLVIGRLQFLSGW